MNDEINLKERIIQKSGELFLTRGYNQTTIRQIAEQVNIGRGHLYYYFRRKEDILLYLLVDMVQEINEREAALDMVNDTWGGYILNEYIYLSVICRIPSLKQIYNEASKIQLLRNEYIKLDNERFIRYIDLSAWDKSAVFMSSILASVAEFELMELGYPVESIVEAVVRVRFSCLRAEANELDRTLSKVEAMYRGAPVENLIKAQMDSLLKRYNFSHRTNGH